MDTIYIFNGMLSTNCPPIKMYNKKLHDITHEFINTVAPPHPNPLPPGERESIVSLLVRVENDREGGQSAKCISKVQI